VTGIEVTHFSVFSLYRLHLSCFSRVFSLSFSTDGQIIAQKNVVPVISAHAGRLEHCYIVTKYHGRCMLCKERYFL
jgi:hypothetical protein